MKEKWFGVFPAITTPFNNDLSVDHKFLDYHCKWLVEHGCKGIVAPGSLGEAAVLSTKEKLDILETIVKSVGDKVPVVAAVSSASTQDACDFARQAQKVGCKGLMVLPPYVYKSDWREMKNHMSCIFNATDLSCMLYNNPVAYGTDFLPQHIFELANEHTNLHAIKESSTDVRRITAIREIMGDKCALFVGVDDAIVEGVNAGAVGWIAGVVNALPKESIDLFEAALNKDTKRAEDLYFWLLPLLRMDTVPKFVQLIKLIQEKMNIGSSRVRPPRLLLEGAELKKATHEIECFISKKNNFY